MIKTTTTNNSLWMNFIVYDHKSIEQQQQQKSEKNNGFFFLVGKLQILNFWKKLMNEYRAYTHNIWPLLLLPLGHSEYECKIKGEREKKKTMKIINFHWIINFIIFNPVRWACVCEETILEKKNGLFSCCTLNFNGIITFSKGKIFSKNNLPMKTKPDQKFSGKLFFPLFFRRRRTLKQNENQTNSIELDTNFFSPILLLLMLYWNEQQTKQKITMWFMKWTREKERKKSIILPKRQNNLCNEICK